MPSGWSTNGQMPGKQVDGLVEEMGNQPFDATGSGREEKSFLIIIMCFVKLFSFSTQSDGSAFKVALLSGPPGF